MDLRSSGCRLGSMNASVQLITSPWSGYAWSPGASATGIMGGGAATPVPHGTGFSWGTIVGAKIGGPVSVNHPSARGIPMTATFVRRYPGGLRGLGFTPCIDDPTLDCSDPSTGGVSTGPGSVTGSPSGISTALAQIFTPLSKAGGAALQQYVSYQNPLYQKQTVALTPQGQVVLATNQPTATTPGAVAAGLSSFLPILLIGGLILVVAMKK